jgi:hypothetical protein
VDQVAEIAERYIHEAAIDYVGLWQISTMVRRHCRTNSNEEVKRLSLDVVWLIVDGGRHPGDYLRTGFHFWPEADTEQIIARIDREWNPARADPTLADPICWFALRNPGGV